MRKHWRAILLALGSSLALLMGLVVTANPAAAQPSACNAGTGCILANLWDLSTTGGGLAIEGNGHNNDLTASPLDEHIGTSFEFIPTSYGYGVLHQVTNFFLCWNTNGSAIGLDSCPSVDTNEWFEFIQYGNYWLIKSWRTDLYVAATNSPSGNNLYFTSGINDTSLWRDVS
jgi:hypothetical protein